MQYINILRTAALLLCPKTPPEKDSRGKSANGIYACSLIYFPPVARILDSFPSPGCYVPKIHVVYLLSLSGSSQIHVRVCTYTYMYEDDA